MTALLFFVGNIFGDVLQLAIQRRAKLVQRLSFHIIVCSQAAYGFAVNTAFFAKHVGADSFFAHYLPQFIKYNHFQPTPLTTIIMGVIIYFDKGI